MALIYICLDYERVYGRYSQLPSYPLAFEGVKARNERNEDGMTTRTGLVHSKLSLDSDYLTVCSAPLDLDDFYVSVSM